MGRFRLKKQTSLDYMKMLIKGRIMKPVRCSSRAYREEASLLFENVMFVFLTISTNHDVTIHADGAIQNHETVSSTDKDVSREEKDSETGTSERKSGQVRRVPFPPLFLSLLPSL